MTQVLGTLAAVYGWFVEPIGWTYALLVWGYALIRLLVNNGIKIWTYRLLRGGVGKHAANLARVQGSLTGQETDTRGRFR